MSPRPIPDPIYMPPRIEIRQWNRFYWGGHVVIGLIDSDVWAFTYKRCEKKARKALAKRQREHERYLNRVVIEVTP